MQRKGRLAVNQPGDRYEQEADRAADAVVSGRAPSFNFSRVSIQKTQREDAAKPKTEEEKYKEAAKKLGEAFLETAPGKEIKAKAEELGDAFISTLPGKIITGAAITGAVAALAAAHKELPIGIPEIPLDRIKPGLKLKITYDGPVDKPTKVMATFSFKFGAESKRESKPAMTQSEKFRAETTKIQKEQYEFRQGLKSPEERAAEERAIYAYVASRMKPTPKASPISFGAAGIQMGLGAGPTSSAQPPAKSVAGSGQFAPPALKLTGESEGTTAEPKKEEEQIQRKETSTNEITEAPPIVEHVVTSQGTPLDAGTRLFMESRFGFDFSKVRIHTDSTAAESARAVNAVAYTVGQDVVFAGGAFSPHTASGQRLLAHELTHIIQQESVPEVDRSGIPPRPATLRRKKDAGTEPDPLARALKGDDDSVRALTNHPSWNAIRLTDDQAARLIIELLKGATLDADERAGLKILNKMTDQDRLDATLETLDAEDRFDQLLDDYHGKEYRDLLELLSEKIKTYKVKALLLDEFVGMWWVNLDEERAIVVILDRTDPADRAQLLTQPDRLDALRSAIDNKGFALEFEELVGEALGDKWEKVSAYLSTVFVISGTGSLLKGQRTKKEIADLLRKAAEELTEELLNYKSRLKEAHDKPGAKPSDVAKINKEFKRRIEKLVEEKKAEYGMELKYNIEFNRLLEEAFGRPWFQKDLREIDDLLAKIPYDILHANRGLGILARSERNPKKKFTAGVAEEGLGQIQLRGELSFSTTAHEIGHFIHYSDETLFKDFLKLSGWQYLDRDDLIFVIRDVNDREKLEERLDKDYQKGEEDEDYNGKDFELGDYVYRFSRYEDAGHYVRRLKKSCFISGYAATEPQDDFAETFAFMFTDPKLLQKQCPEKYEFMHVRVMADYRLNQQKSKILKAFDSIVSDVIVGGGSLGDDIDDKYVKPMRAGLVNALDKQRAAQVTLAKASVKVKPKPIPMEAAAEKLAEPQLEMARRFQVAAQPVIDRYEDFLSLAEVMREKKEFVAAEFEEAFDELTEYLGNFMRQELLTALDPVATRVLLGEEVTMTTWPEVDAIKAKYYQRLLIIKPYLPVVHESYLQRHEAWDLGRDILKQIKDKPRRDRVRVKIAKIMNDELAKELKNFRLEIAARIRDGKRFDKQQVKSSKTLGAIYKKKIANVPKETK